MTSLADRLEALAATTAAKVTALEMAADGIEHGNHRALTKATATGGGE